MLFKMKTPLTTMLLILGCGVLFLPVSLHAQAPQTIIIASENAHSTGDEPDFLDLPTIRYDGQNAPPDCKPINLSTGDIRSFQVDIHDVVHLPSQIPANQLESVLITAHINHADLNGPVYHTETFLLTDIAVLSGNILEIPLSFSFDVVPDYMFDPHMVIELNLYLRRTGVVPTPDDSGFEFRGLGRYHIDICNYRTLKYGNNRVGLSEYPHLIQSAPNPFTDFVEVKSLASATTPPQVQILDMQGKTQKLKIRQKYTGNDTWIASVPTAQIPAGIYLIKVQIVDKTYYTKIIKH